MSDRHVFAFKNGIYYAQKNLFIKSHEPKSTDPDLIDLKPCQTFKVPFNNSYYKTWKLIPTHVFDYILEYQYQYSNGKCNIKEWFYIIMGRLLYNRGELDNWDIFPVFVGEPGTGKSLIINTGTAFYQNKDLANIPTAINDLRFHNWKVLCLTRYLCTLLGPVSSKQLISLIKGDEFDIPVRYQPIYGEKKTWVLPGVMEGNTDQFLGVYTKDLETLNDHLVTFFFEITPKQNDKSYGEKINNEMGNLLRKCNMAYLEAVERYGRDYDGIKDMIPKELCLKNHIK